MGNPNLRPLNSYDSTLKSILKNWGLSGEVSLISNTENTIFKIETENGSLIVARFTEIDHRSINDVEAEVHWLDYLKKNNINLAFPIADLNGNLVQSLNIENKTVTVVFFNWAQGKLLDRGSRWASKQFEEIGSYLGRLHFLSKGYIPAKEYKRYKWNDTQQIKSIYHYLPETYHKEADASLKWIQSLSASSESFGLVHADLHGGNFHVHDKKLVSFDFDDCCYHFFSYDLAIPIFDVFQNNNNWNMSDREKENVLASLFIGYEENNELSVIWKKRVKCFVRYRRLELMSWVYMMYYENDPKQKIKKMEFSLGKYIKNPEIEYI